jgi:1-acyl-sn-glycerol-3-phosphate acyltransferase
VKVYAVVRRLFLMTAAPMFRFRVLGADNMPEHGPVIVVAPHRSWLDPAVVGGACPRPVHFLIMRKIYRKPWARWFYRAMQALPVEPGGARSLASLREAMRRLDRGEVVGVFPEGHVVRAGHPSRVHPGTAMLAAHCGAPVVPVEIRGSARAWPHGRRYPLPARVQASIGTPIAPPGRRDRAALAALTRRLEGLMTELGDPPGAGEPG